MFNSLVGKAVIIAQCNGARHRHVAFILKKKIPVCIGWNKQKSHPAIERHPYKPETAHIHAELDAVIKNGEVDYSQYTMVVMRIKKNGTIANSKPCLGCQHVLKQVGFKSVFYSTEYGNFARL